MAGLNVAEWTPEQVAEWMSGLGPTVAQYVPGLKARGLDGVKLLTLRCDDLEYLGMHIIGHQELLLEAVEHLRNFHYELSRECIQQLALRVSVVATSVVRALRNHADARLETQTLADVARLVNAVKPLVCWLDRWSLSGGGGGRSVPECVGSQRTQLLQLSLEAATCAQRERFAEQPARAVRAAASAAAAAAAYILQEACDPRVLAGGALAAVTLRQRHRPLGFDVRASFCGHHQLANIRFGSPAHASGAVHPGDEIVQVGGRCVIGWSGAEVEAACMESAAGGGGGAGGGELQLRLRRRGTAVPPPPRRLPRHHLYCDRSEVGTGRSTIAPPPLQRKEAEECAVDSSDGSEPLSPPASPTHTDRHDARMYPRPPPPPPQRRHSVSGGTPRAKRPAHTIEQLWQQLKEQRGERAAGGSAGGSPEPGDVTLYARDKAVSYSTGLELAPRPRTCLGSVPERRAPAGPAPPAGAPPAGVGADGEAERARGKLDKAHSTPAYDLGGVEGGAGAGGGETPAAIPESPTTPTDSPTVVVHSAEKADQILQFKKCSSAIGEALSHRRTPGPDRPHCGDTAPQGSVARDESERDKILETINIAMMEHRRRSLLEGATMTPARGLKVSASDCGRTPPLDTPTEEKIAPRYSYLRSTSRRVSPPPSPPPRPSPAPPAALPAPAPSPRPPQDALPVLRAVPRGNDREPTSPMKPMRPIDATQISVPLRHITKHDIRMIPSDQSRQLPAINTPTAPAPASPADSLQYGASTGGGGGAEDTRGIALSPTSAVRGIFPTSKSRSLKKKSSILAKRRMVPWRAVCGRGACGGVWQRVRARQCGAAPRWVRRHLLLTHNLLYAYRGQECNKADCMIYLEGYTVCAAGEVKSRAHAFKVYHTGNAFYFACDSRDAMLAWIQLIHRATLLPSLLSQADASRHFSETDYSETESDTESPEKRSDKDKERDKDKDKDRDKDKSKFGSLKKLTGRVQRSESQENVSHSSTSLDRKYLRFFSRHKSKDDTKLKNKQSNVPVPTEHYRSYRRVPPPPPAGASPPPAASSPSPSPAPSATPFNTELRASKKIPKPINYIHASNPNLLDFEKSDFVTKPTLQVPTKPKVAKTENLVGFVTLEQFMLKKQEEERRQVYSNRVLLGIERDRKHLQQRLDRIVPDVIYGEVGAADIPLPVLELQAAASAASAASSISSASYKERRPEPGKGKPISVKGKDGYEKIVYTDDPPSGGEREGPPSTPPRRPAPPPAPERWRDSLRRNDKVHSTAKVPTSAVPSPALDTWNNNNNNNNSSDSSPSTGSGSGSGGGGVSRLRLMFGGRPHAQSPPAGSPPRAVGAAPPPPPPPRIDGGAGRGHYPHLQCPPTFQPETYSLASHPRRPRDRDTHT